MSDRPDSAPQAAGPPRELTGRIGKYEILRLLGKGAMGQVYLAHDTILEREIALKVMVSQIADDPDLKTRFEREAKTVARMTHPNIVTVFDFGYHTDGSPYIAMELLRGQDLQKAVRTGPPLSIEQKVVIVLQVLGGLAHAHQSGIVHRDIKPANIFLNADGTTKLMDFGVARLTTASMTGTGNIVGTADYMSPEQVRGAKVDGRSDLFSVGCVLFELLAGRRPFHSDNLMAIFYKITHEEPTWDLLPGDEAHASLVPVLARALSKDLDERYATAAEFANELKKWLRATGGGAQVQSALEALVDDAAPTVPPASDEATVVTGPSLVGTERSRSAHPATAPTGRASTAPTARASVAPTALQPTPSQPGARPARPRSSAPIPPPEARRSSVLPLVLGGGGILVVGVLAWVGLVVKPWEHKPTPAPSVAAAQPTPASTPTPAPSEEPTAVALPPMPSPFPTNAARPTTAPPPVVTDTPGSKSAAGIKAAKTAFEASDYDKALSLAQKALADDPASAAARQLVENAQAGQRAMSLLQASEQALKAGDFAQAQSQGEAAQKAAPWDPRVTGFLNRVRDAQMQAQAQRDRQAREAQVRQITGLLQRADAALDQQQYDQAVSLYDEVLKARSHECEGRSRTNRGHRARGPRPLARARWHPPVRGSSSPARPRRRAPRPERVRCPKGSRRPRM